MDRENESSSSSSMNHHSSFLSPLFAALDYQDTLEKRSQIQQQDESITDPSSKIAVTEGGESSSSMYYTGYQSRGSSSEERDNGSNPAVGQYPQQQQQQQQGFVRYGTEVPPVYPGMNNLWNPQPVVNPYQYGCFPYNNVFGSGTVEPNPKQKTEDFWNSHNPQQMENVYDHAPALHSGFVPYQAMFQNPFFSASLRGPWNESFTSLISKPQDPHDDYPLAPKPVRGQVLNLSPSAPFTKNEELNVSATSQGLPEETTRDVCAPISQHKRKRTGSPSYVSSTNNASTLDGNDNDDMEPSSRHATSPWLGQCAAETLVSLKSAGASIAANTYNFEEEIDMETNDCALLIRKELRNTDVGNLGRIVLPKRDAEANLPQLVTKDGIFLQMEDMTFTTRWRFKYRYWPNNKSRMYVMENTGDFVRKHNLQTGDYFIIYKDRHTGKYIAQGRKGKKSLYSGDDERSDEGDTDATEKSSGSNNNVSAENVSSKQKMSGSSRFIKRL